MRRVELPQNVVQRALAAGRLGVKWMDELPGLVDDLSVRWGIEVGLPMAGGSAALVAPAVCHADGTEAVLRIDMPADGTHGEFLRGVRVLGRAEGRGYPRLLEVEAADRACLIERLGAPLSSSGLPVDDQIRAICGALTDAWKASPRGLDLPDTAASVEWHSAFIDAEWEALGRPCPREVVDRAHEVLEARRTGWHPAGSVLLHGDAHAANTLEDPKRPGSYRLIDPDGGIGDRAEDLGVIMREWPEQYVAAGGAAGGTAGGAGGGAGGDAGGGAADGAGGGPVAERDRRAALLADLTGGDVDAIRDWGYIQTVSTAFVLLRIGGVGVGLADAGAGGGAGVGAGGGARVGAGVGASGTTGSSGRTSTVQVKIARTMLDVASAWASA